MKHESTRRRKGPQQRKRRFAPTVKRQYWCPYCKMYLKSNKLSTRREHEIGHKHIHNVEKYYENWKMEKPEEFAAVQAETKASHLDAQLILNSASVADAVESNVPPPANGAMALPLTHIGSGIVIGGNPSQVSGATPAVRVGGSVVSDGVVAAAPVQVHATKAPMVRVGSVGLPNIGDSSLLPPQPQ